MIEAGVKWPDGAEYAAQDKRGSVLHFYKEAKPFISKVIPFTWDSGGGCRWMGGSSSVQLQSLCHNWNKTIVTREQYDDAVAAAGNGEHEQQSRSGVAGVMPSETIESLLAEIKAKREERDALVAKSDALALEIVSIEQKVSDKLKKYGFAISPVAATSDPVQPIITDWRDLRVGDVVECVDYNTHKEGVIVEIDNEDEDQPIKVERGDCNITSLPSSWRFIRRP